MEDVKNDGGSAFPHEYDAANAFGVAVRMTDHGMSLRDWFAGQALAGLCAQHSERFTTITADEMAEIAYVVAHAMLRYRLKGDFGLGAPRPFDEGADD